MILVGKVAQRELRGSDLYLRRIVATSIVALVAAFGAVIVLPNLYAALISSRFLFEILKSALDLTVRSTFATSYAAIARDIFVALYVGFRILRREGRQGVSHWASKGRDAASAVALAFMITFFYHALGTVPNQIRAKANSIKAPSWQMPKVPGWSLENRQRVEFSAGRATPAPAVPPLRGSSQFLTNVVVTAGNVVLCPMNIQPPRLDSCLDIRSAAKGHISEEPMTSLGEILQHYMVPLTWLAGHGSGGGSQSSTRFSRIDIPPIDPPEYEKCKPRELLKRETPNADGWPFPFWFMLDEPQMKLPKGTALVFTTEPSQEHRSSYVARFEKNGYYQLDLSVYGYSAPKRGLIPNGYEVSEYWNPIMSQLTTYEFIVRFDWTIQRSQPKTFVVEDYERWTKELFENVRLRLAN